MSEVQSASSGSRQLPLSPWEVRGPFGYGIDIAHASTVGLKNRVERGGDEPRPGG